MHLSLLSRRGALILGAITGIIPCGAAGVNATTPTISFLPPVSIPLTGAVRAYVTDLDGDGHKDIVTYITSSTTATVTVLYGLGDGTFTAVHYPQIINPSGVTFADFNGDGKKDIAISGSNEATVFLATGIRTFDTGTPYAAQDGSGEITSGNFTADNKPDLAMVNNGSGTLSVFTNKGDGTFNAAANQGTGQFPTNITNADINGDGKLDLITTKAMTFESPCFTGDGLGVFTPTITVPVGGGPILAADFNNDHLLDLAGGEYWNGGLKIAIGDGHGNFATTFHYGTDQYPSTLFAGDFNGDGFTDLIMGQGHDFFTIWANTGTGTGEMLAPVEIHTTASNLYTGGIGDFDEDGQLDVVIVGWNDHIAIAYNNTLPNPVPSLTSMTPTNVAGGGPSFTLTVHGTNLRRSSVVNWNGTPLATTFSAGTLSATVPAAFVSSSRTAAITVTTPTPGGGTSNALLFTVSGFAVGSDFNGDGKTDLVLQNTASNKVALWYMNGDTLLGGAYTSITAPAEWHVVAVADFNADVKPDLVLQNVFTNQVAVWYMNGAAFITSAFTSPAPPAGWRVAAAADLNADGKPDLILQNSSTNKVAFWYLNGVTLTSGAYTSVTPAAGWSVVGAGDFNGDNKVDLVLQNATTNKVAIWFMNGATLSTGAYTSSTPPAGWHVVGVGDFNTDGKPDIVLQSASTNKVALWYMNGATVTGGAYTSSAPSAEWKVVGPR